MIASGTRVTWVRGATELSGMIVYFIHVPLAKPPFDVIYLIDTPRGRHHEYPHNLALIT